MKLSNIILLVTVAVLLPTKLRAETLVVSYASFYSHIKKLDDPETDALRFAFGFQHIAKQRLCHISSAKIVTQKQTLPLTVENNSRFTVPTDKILKMAKANVVIELDDQANRCDMSVQLETLPRFLKTQYSHEELLLLLNQYQAFFDGMGSFLSFMMPSVTGLLLHFNPDENVPKELHPLLDEKGRIALSENWLARKETLKLIHKPLRITAIIEK